MLSVSEFPHTYGSAERTVPSHLLPCIRFRDCALQASTVSSTPWSTSLGSYKAFDCLGQHLATTQCPMPTNTSNCFATFMGLLCLLVRNTKHPLLRHTRLLATNPSSLALLRNSRQQPWAGSKNIIMIQNHRRNLTNTHSRWVNTDISLLYESILE